MVLAAHCALRLLLIHLASYCSFKRGGDVDSHHNKLRDVIAESCRRAHLGVQVEMGSNSHAPITATPI